jgi:hypothetical protein
MTRKRGRPSKPDDEALQPITALVPSEVKQTLEVEAAREGRPLSEIVRRRLGNADNSARPPVDDFSSPARALGRLVELHAGDVAAYCETAEGWQKEMKNSVPILLAGLFDQSAPATGGEDTLSATFARTLAQRVRRAHLPAAQGKGDAWGARAARAAADVQPSLAALQADELHQIQKALGLAPPTKGKK